jgi:hypothetical protein
LTTAGTAKGKSETVLTKGHGEHGEEQYFFRTGAVFPEQ